jgi:hypothetical protein
MSLQKARDRQYEKTAQRLDAASDDAIRIDDEAGTYDGPEPDQSTGSSQRVTLDDGGVIWGEFITPSAVAIGARVAVYRSNSGNLFDSL